MGNQNFCDKEMFTDILSSQKFSASGYNTFAGECSNPAVKTDFINILVEEHQIQGEVFNEMNKRGWYPVEAADKNKITQTKQKYQSMSI